MYRIPQDDPSGDSVILRRGEFERIRQKAQVVTAEERAAVEAAQKLAKESALVCMNIDLNTVEPFYGHLTSMTSHHYGHPC